MSVPSPPLVRARVAFRDRGILDVMDLALRFIVVYGKSYALLALVVLLPALIVSSLAGEEWGWADGWLVALLLASFAQVPFTLLASRLVFQSDVSVRDVIVSSLRDLFRVVGVRIAFGFIVLVGSLAFFIGALWPLSAFFYVDEVLLLERPRVLAAFGRAQRVAASGRGESFLCLLVLALGALLAVAFADIGGRAVIGELLQFRPPRSAWSEGGSILCFVGLFTYVPYRATVRFFTYLDVRTRSEGWDIQTRFAAIATRASDDAQGARA